MSSSAGRYASDRAWLARATFAGSARGKQVGIFADDRQAGGATAEGNGHTVVQPAGGLVETIVGGEAIAQQRGFVVCQHRGDQRCAGAIGVRCDAPRQRQRFQRCGHQQFLAGLEAAEPDPHSNLREAVEAGVVRRGRRGGADVHCVILRPMCRAWVRIPCDGTCVMAGAGRPSCVRKRALSGGCKSVLGLPTKPEAEGNCVIARWGGEQLEAKKQSVGTRTRFGRAVWRASGGRAKPRPAQAGSLRR